MEHHHRHHRAGDVGHHARLLAEEPLEHEELGGEEGTDWEEQDEDGVEQDGGEHRTVVLKGDKLFKFS